MEEGFPAAEEPEPYELSPQERRDVEADLEDLGKMHDVFSPQGVKGVGRENFLVRQRVSACFSTRFFEGEI